MTSREKFEKWFEGMFCVDDVRFKYMAEIAWQASRAAIEIELPEPMNPSSVFFGEFERGEAKGISECVNKIEQAGLKVKK